MSPGPAVAVRRPRSNSSPMEPRRWLIVIEVGIRDPAQMVQTTVDHVVRAAAWCQDRLRADRPDDEDQPRAETPRPLFEVVTTGSGGVDLPPSRSDEDGVVVVGPGCRLEEKTLAALVNVIGSNPRVDLVYGDSTVESSDGSRPELRPGYSPDRLDAQPYLGEVIAVRRPLWDAVVGRRSTGSGVLVDHDRAVALCRTARSVAHVPRPLYRRSASTDVGLVHLERVVATQASVSVIIPTNGARRQVRGGNVCLVVQAVASIIDGRGRGSDRPALPEIVIVTTPGIDDTVTAELRMLVAGHGDEPEVTLRIVHDDRSFNFSNACNRGAVEATGEVLVFLNDDTEVITADWLERLAAWTSDPGIGAVGARLYYEDGTIQHNGLWTRGGHPAHRYERYQRNAHGHLGSLTVAQNCLAVTGACLAVRAELFDRVGGFSPVFPSSYNDVDLCLKLLDRGHRTVIDPAVELFHFEASSRDPSISDEELALLHDRWRSVLNNDPFDNPNFDAPGCEELPLPPAQDVAVLDAEEVERPPVRVWPLEPLAAR